MSDAAPGRITDASGWPGRWETITREDYWQVIGENGGLDSLTVASSCTEPPQYVLTAWARRDQDYPLVQNEMRDCVGADPTACPGVHTFSRFIYEPATEDD
jgi:hypothetical protein